MIDEMSTKRLVCAHERSYLSQVLSIWTQVGGSDGLSSLYFVFLPNLRIMNCYLNVSLQHQNDLVSKWSKDQVIFVILCMLNLKMSPKCVFAVILFPSGREVFV